VVSRGQCRLVGLIPAGRGSKGLGRPCAGLGLPDIPFANFRRAKFLRFAPLLEMPKDWREGSQAAVAVRRIGAYNGGYGDTEPDDAGLAYSGERGGVGGVF
jgi:hypothetical protein